MSLTILRQSQPCYALSMVRYKWGTNPFNHKMKYKVNHFLTQSDHIVVTDVQYVIIKVCVGFVFKMPEKGREYTHGYHTVNPHI